MLDTRDYTIAEICEVIGGSAEPANIKKRLNNYDIVYTTSGRSTATIFHIQEIRNPFKLFCRLYLDIPAQVDFERFAYFVCYYLNDESFRDLPDVKKKIYLDDVDMHISRQTIRNWTDYLIRKNWICQNGDYIYYFACKGDFTQTSRETYNQAWREYFADKNKGCSSDVAMMYMISKYGGCARKHEITVDNGWYTEQLNTLNALACDVVETNLGDHLTH